MHVMIIGAAGMVGRKLADRLAGDGRLGGRDVERLTLVDVVAPSAPASFGGAVETVMVDLSATGEARKLAARRADVVFHLAAIVSGEAEADFDKGYRINLDGTRHLFEAIRREGLRQPLQATPRLHLVDRGVRRAFPGAHRDEFLLTPLTSYGTQKAIGELLLGDYSRRGFVEGIGIRLPTICVRPGAPNKAASGFFSNILREPLVGQEGRAAGADGRAPLVRQPPRCRGLPAPCGDHRPREARDKAHAEPPRPIRHRRRGDRSAAARRWERSRPSHPTRT